MQRIGIKRVRSKPKGDRVTDGDRERIDDVLEFIDGSVSDRELDFEYNGRTLHSMPYSDY